MTYDPEKHHRRLVRLKGYDYAQSGAYFVTVVTQARACLFGEIVNAEARLNDAGSVIERWWFELNNKFRTVETDEFVIMPNHFHGIVVIPVGADLCVGPVGKGTHPSTVLRTGSGAPLQGTPQPTTGIGMGAGVNPDAHPAHQGTHAGVPLQGTHPVRPVALPAIVQWFKTMTTNEYLRGVKTSSWAPFQGQLWQRNYYEHVIRDEDSLNRIRRYLHDNPARWEFDHENPAATTPEPENAWRA